MISELHSRASSVGTSARQMAGNASPQKSSSASGSTAEKGAASAWPEPSPDSSLPATVSAVQQTALFRPCRFYQDITLPSAQRVGMIAFRNHFVSSVSVQRHCGGGGAQWERMVTDQALMPNCHYSEGATGCFAIPLHGPSEELPLCTRLRIYLLQPSPCWMHLDVRLESIRVYSCRATMESIRVALHDVSSTVADAKAAKATSPKKGKPQAPSLSPPVSLMKFSHELAKKADNVEAMSSICAALYETLHAWKVSDLLGLPPAGAASEPPTQIVSTPHAEEGEDMEAVKPRNLK